MTDRTAAKRVREYTARSKEAGLVRVTVWVPKDGADEIRETAARLRAEARKCSGAEET